MGRVVFILFMGCMHEPFFGFGFFCYFCYFALSCCVQVGALIILYRVCMFTHLHCRLHVGNRAGKEVVVVSVACQGGVVHLHPHSFHVALELWGEVH